MAEKELLEFDILKETWGTYYLEDGLTLRIKFNLIFLWTNPEEPGSVGIRSKNTVGLLCSENHKVSDDERQEALDQPKETVEIYEDYEEISTARSIYLVEEWDQMIAFRLRPVEIRRTNHYDDNNEPLIEVDSISDGLLGAGPQEEVPGEVTPAS